MTMRMRSLLVLLLLLAAHASSAGNIPVGAAPKGDPTKVGTRIIKYNFPDCKRVTSATRLPDGSIRATCDGTDYRVFTLFDAKEGKTLELALNCEAAKRLINVDCY